MELNNTLNPKSALEALFPQPIDCGEGVVVKPFSLAVYALLEKIGSYIVIPHEPTQEEVIKSFYICTHEAKDAFKNFADLDGLAISWADSLRPAMYQRIADAILTQIEAVKSVMPPPKENDGKKAAMDG